MEKETKDYLSSYLVIIILSAIALALLVTACIQGFWNQVWFLKAIILLVFLILVDAVRNFVMRGIKDPKKRHVVCCIIVRVLIALLALCCLIYFFRNGY